jgi:indole-3-glycerol phosphate synthase
MLKKVQIFKALDIEIKKQKGPAAVKESYKGHHSLKEELSQPGISIITEVSGGNPLRGQVRESYRASTHAKSLVDNGARALSVATDRFLYFGEDRHLSEVRATVKVPLIRQDFIFEEYQIEESKILGADAVFLMAALLETPRLQALIQLALAKGLDVVVQVASEGDLKRALEANADIICVLGRDLDTWEPSWEKALALMKKVPEKKCLRMIEAGICTLQQIQELEALGVHGAIIGDALLDEFYPGKRLAQILSGVESAKKVSKAKTKNDASASSSSTSSDTGLASKTKKSSSKESRNKPTGGAAKAATLLPSTSLSHPARKGKKEFPMEHIQLPDEITTPVESTGDAAAAAPKKAPRKPAAKKAAVKKPAVKKPAAKKPAAKKPAVKKPAVKKPAVKKAVKKAAPKKPAVKKAVKKAAPKKPAVKKAVKKAAPKKAVKKVVKKAVKKAAPKKPAAKKVVKKAVAKKIVKKAAPKKPAAKKVVAKKAAPKKPAAKKVVKKAVKK